MIIVINIVVTAMVVNNVMVMVINIPPYAHPGPQSLGTGNWYVTHPPPALGAFWPACIAGQGIRWTAGLRARTAAAGRYGARVQAPDIATWPERENGTSPTGCSCITEFRLQTDVYSSSGCMDFSPNLREVKICVAQ